MVQDYSVSVLGSGFEEPALEHKNKIPHKRDFSISSKNDQDFTLGFTVDLTGLAGGAGFNSPLRVEANFIAS